MKTSTTLPLLLIFLLSACQPSAPGKPTPAAPAPDLIPSITNTARPPPENPTQAPSAIAEPPTPSPIPFDLAGLPADSWTQLSRMPTSRSEMAAVVLGDRIHIPGGLGNSLDEFAARAHEAYDPQTDTWMKLAPMPAGRHHAMAAGLDGLLYVFGGACVPACTSGSNSTWVYDPSSDTWDSRAPMPERRSSGAAVTIDGFIYIVGGVGDTGDLLRFDPARNEWARLAPLNERREHNAAAAVNGEIYALGGRWLVEMDSVEAYDPDTDTWREVRSMFTARAGHAAAVLNDKIYVMGGEVFLSTNSPVTLDSVEIFDPGSGVWVLGDPLPLPLHGLPAVTYEGLLYALGGSTRAASVGNQGWIYVWKP